MADHSTIHDEARARKSAEAGKSSGLVRMVEGLLGKPDAFIGMKLGVLVLIGMDPADWITEMTWRMAQKLSPNSKPR